MSTSAVLAARTYYPKQVFELAALKPRESDAWSLGEYPVFGATLQIAAENLCEVLDLRAGSTVLDVASGGGNASIAAARRWCVVAAVDSVASHLDKARERASANGMDIAFREARPEALPFADASFDFVISSFGVMHASDQGRAVEEMFRICKAGGAIGLTHWTSDGFIGRVFEAIGEYYSGSTGEQFVSPCAMVDMAEGTFQALGASVVSTPRDFVLRYRSPRHWLGVFREVYGPVVKAFDALSLGDRAALGARLIALAKQFNRASDGSMVVPSAYLETVVRKR